MSSQLTPIELLQELIKIDTTNPPGDESGAAELLKSYLVGAGLQARILSSPEGRPNLVARLEGPRDRCPLILLSHTDVVAVEEESWSRDPFGGEAAQGCVWGRGALDMKGIAVMHAVAAAALAGSGHDLTREVIVLAVADEEAGGGQGARWLTEEHSQEVGLSDGTPPEVLGEGGYGLSGLLDRPLMPIVLGEKSTLWLSLHATGEPGHGSMPPPRQALHNLTAFVNDVAGRHNVRVHPVMREQFSGLADHVGGGRKTVFTLLASRMGNSFAKLVDKQMQKAGAVGQLLVDTVTPTQFSAGYKRNVVPGEASAALDCRLLPDTDLEAFLSHLEKKASRRDVEIEVVIRESSPVSERTPLFDIISDVSRRVVKPNEGEPVIVPSLTAPMTDIRFYRARGAGGYGWAPLILSRELLATIHGHDERVPIADFERGVEAMAEVVRRAAG